MNEEPPILPEDTERAKTWLRQCLCPEWADEWRAVQYLASEFARARHGKPPWVREEIKKRPT